MKRILSIIPVILCMLFSHLHAQVFTHYRSAADYNNMTDVVFDKEGNTWYATYAAGVLKYDGSGWMSYTEKDGLASDQTTSIACDTEGNIWVGTCKGISVYDGIEWTSFFTNRVDCVGSLEADSFGNVWFAHGGGISKYDGSGWTHIFAFMTGDEAIAVDTDSTFWMGGGLSYGVAYYKGVEMGEDPLEGRNWIGYTTEDGLVHNHVRTIEIDREGNVWVGTEGGVSKFDGADWTNYTENNGLPSNDVIDIAIDTEGRIWCASPTGVSLFDGQNWISPEKPDFAMGLIHSLVASEDGAILVGFNAGILFNSYLKYDGSEWTTLEAFDKCVAGYVFAVAEDDLGNKWFGTNTGLSKLEKGNWTTYTTGDGLADLWVNDIFIDNEGIIWCATNGGLSVFDEDSWISYSVDDGLASNLIRTITQDGSGNLLVGTEDGVSVFDGTIWKTYTGEDGIASDRVNAVETDPEGMVWIGTDNGITRYDGSSWLTFMTEDGLADNLVNAIAFDTSGALYCATYNGVSTFDGKKWTVLCEGNITHIAFDSENSLWMARAGEWGSPKGITKFDGTKFIHYSEEDGLPVSGNIFIDSGDTLWTGSTLLADVIEPGGFTVMPPKNDYEAPTAVVSYNDDDIRVGDALVITASFDEPMLSSHDVIIAMDGAVDLIMEPMLRENETTYSYTYLVPNEGGKVTVQLEGGFDLWGNKLDPTPVSGEIFSITPVNLGDVDGVGAINAFDAALALQRTDTLNEFCFVPPPTDPSWENWQDTAANVDGIEGISVKDAKMILKQSTEISPLAAPNLLAPLQGSVVLVPYDNYIEFYSTGNLHGLNIEAYMGKELLGSPELMYDGFLSVFNIESDHYRVGLCGKCSPWESTLLMRIPVKGEGQVIFWMIANTALIGPVAVDVMLVTVPETAADLMIYPNPADDLLMIQGLNEPGTLKIYSMTGKLIQKESLQSDPAEINVSELPEGIYIFNIETEEDNFMKKISVR